MTSVLKKVAIGLALLLLALVFAFFWYRGASQPKTDGVIKLSGLHQPVDIVRDAEGVPHIYAKTTDDAYFALGFVHAQDRLWQMEMNRRIAAGRLAEILGPGALATDRFLRTLGVRRNAERILQHLTPDTRAALDAYARGVNAWLDQRDKPLPPEFLITGAPAPAHWQPVDSIGWQTMMAWDLSANWSQELLRMRLSQRLSLDQINQFLPPYPGDAPVATRDYTRLYRQLTGTTGQLAAVAAIAPPSLLEGMGSNDWVVSGALTKSGKPLLANDPHLGLSAPALWYFAQLSAPGLDVIGATLPGIPVVVLGRNDRIAWGFTNTASDVQDLYIERINPADKKQYQTPDGWADFRERIEIIKVKGQPDVSLKVRETRHGPVITGALPIADRAALDAGKYVIAFQWTALRDDDRTLQAGLGFNRARNWQQFLDAARDFGAPEQNIVYADVDGNIGFIAPARVPLRKPDNDLKGLAPAPGWDARYDWDGFIPFDALPRSYNPPSHMIVTANQKIVGSDYPYFLTSEWTLPYRSDRITRLLNARTAHSVDSFAKIQMDTVSLAAQELLPRLRKLVPKSDREKQALDTLLGWNGAMDMNRPEPLIFNAWMRETSRRIFGDELGDALMKDYWRQRNVHQVMVDVLNNRNGEARWCADVTKGEAGRKQSCDDVLRAALDAAIDQLEQRYGTEMSKWRWGEAHPAVSEHRPFDKVPLLARFFDIRLPSPGDSYTVDVGRYDLANEQDPFASHHAPSLRAVYDLANPENSRFMQSTGQSGNVFSGFYRNFAQRWVDGGMIPMQTRRANVEKNALGVLTLQPKP